jgi:hypothetical protein
MKKEKINGRTRYWVKNEEGGDKTVIFTVLYLGNCGCGFSRKVTRKIELKEIQTLDDLCRSIIYKSFGWDDPHMYSFFFDNRPYSRNRKMEYCCEVEEDALTGEKSNSTKTKLKDLLLKKGQKFLFIFDFGDDHQFGIKVEGFGETQKGKEYPLIIDENGKAPKQY